MGGDAGGGGGVFLSIGFLSISLPTARPSSKGTAIRGERPM
jgi:hypothetical protein